MELSKRLNSIASMVNPVHKVADIGTDHGYMPIYLIENLICDYVIATDINKGPLEKAKKNIMKAKINEKVELRLGAGLNVIGKGEVESAIISGMGGDLTRDILLSNMDVFKSMKYIVVQPAQNVDVFRKFVYEKGFKIIAENMCFEDGKYYETIKLCYDENSLIKPAIFYEISEFLYMRKDPVLKDYMKWLVEKYNNIIQGFHSESENVAKRRVELRQKVILIEELLKKM